MRTAGGVSRFELKFRVSRLFDMLCRLCKGYEEVSFPERHLPYTLFRKQVTALEQHAKALLNDTLVKILIQLALPSNSHYTRCASENNSAMRG